MKPQVFAIISVLLAFSATGQAYSCGGLLQGDAGQLEFPIEGNAEGESNCLWIIQLLSGSGVRFTLNRLGSAAVLSLYPEHEATESVLTPIRLEASAVNSTILATGQVLIVTLSKSTSSSGVSFAWESDSAVNPAAPRAASYVDTLEGRVSWTKFGQQERMTFGVGVDPSSTLTLHTTTDFGRCNLLDPCQCTYFALYEVTPDGYLREATRVCGRPSEATIENLYSQIVAFVYVNTTDAQDSTASVELTWLAASDETTTTTTTTSTSVSTETPAIKLACGGLINLPESPAEVVAEYKFGESYGYNEFCVWPLAAPNQFGSATVRLEGGDGLENCCDGIAVYSLNSTDSRNSGLSKCRLTSEGCTLQRGVGFIAFTSDDSVAGTGFRLSITTTKSVTGYYDSLHFIDELSGTYRFPQSGSYRRYDRALIVLQQPVGFVNNLQISSLDTENDYDYVHILAIPNSVSTTNATVNGKWSGYYPSGVEGSLSSASSPRAVLFTADNSNHGTGFEIKWSVDQTKMEVTNTDTNEPRMKPHRFLHKKLLSTSQ